MRAFSNGSGEILVAMTYPEIELLQQVVEFAANGSGSHRGAEYVNVNLTIALQEALPLPLEVVEKAAEEEASARKKRHGRRAVSNV